MRKKKKEKQVNNNSALATDIYHTHTCEHTLGLCRYGSYVRHYFTISFYLFYSPLLIESWDTREKLLSLAIMATTPAGITVFSYLLFYCRLGANVLPSRLFHKNKDKREGEVKENKEIKPCLVDKFFFRSRRTVAVINFIISYSHYVYFWYSVFKCTIKFRETGRATGCGWLRLAGRSTLCDIEASSGWLRRCARICLSIS